MAYAGLSRAQLSYEYLHTNSTTHEFLFGALAELLDNARDAGATKIDIFSVSDPRLRGEYMLCFLDDGAGMDPVEAQDIITFGKSAKKDLESHHIGMYGNGLKSGSMRIGHDFILFTKKEQALTCVFLSRTFHEEENIEEVIVPIPCFDVATKTPVARGVKAQEKHAMEIGLILKYSPFKTEEELMKQFDRINSKSGTLVIVYNLKLLDSGEPELDIKTTPKDILLSKSSDDDYDTEDGLMPERRSFRAYASILYVEPRMKIYIQGKKVQTKRLASCLYKPKCYKYSSSRFKTRSENEAKKAQEQARSAEHKAKEAMSRLKDLEKKVGSSTAKEARAQLRKAQAESAELQRDAQLKKQIAQRKSKSLKDPKVLQLVFGINLANRNQDGMFVYNCSRLIKMYEKVGPQVDGGVFCSGVVGIVDVPYLVLEPTHNKQDFADAKEYRHLMKAMGEHMSQYWKDVGVASQGVTNFWENFGYIDHNWKNPPSNDPKFLRKRAMQVSSCIQCDQCLKWRILPFSSSNVGKEYSDNWVCSMNPDPSHNKCSSAEQKLNIPEGVLKREVKSKEQKEKELAEQIKKKQEQLQSMKKTQVVTSSRQARQQRKQESSEEEESEEEEESSEEEEPPPRKAAGRKVEPRKPPTPIRRKPSPPRPKSASKPVSQNSIRKPAYLSRNETKVTSSNKPKPAVKSPVVTSTKSDSKPSPKPASATLKRKASESSAMSSAASEESDVEAAPIKKKSVSDEVDDNVPMETMTTDDEITSEDPDNEIGTKVEARINKQWHGGMVVKVNKKQGKWKIKFDKYPKDKYDKWFDQSSPDLKVPGITKTEAKTESVAESTSSEPIKEDPVEESTTEVPCSSTTPSTTASTTALTSQNMDDIASGYRTCLRYFLPPQWIMDKDSVSGLSLNELATFPLEDFFDHYEKGLRKLVSNFQSDAQAKQQEAEQAKNKLSNVRKMIAKLLKSINEEFDIDPEADTEQVDELLAACVKQAVQQNETNGE